MSLDQDNQDDYPNFGGYHPNPDFRQDDRQDEKKTKQDSDPDSNSAILRSSCCHPVIICIWNKLAIHHPGVILVSSYMVTQCCVNMRRCRCCHCCYCCCRLLSSWCHRVAKLENCDLRESSWCHPDASRPELKKKRPMDSPKKVFSIRMIWPD